MRVGILSLLLLCAGCTTLNSYAVVAPRADLDDTSGCFRQCQPVRAGGMNPYLKCVSTCPGVSVTNGESCREVHAANHYECMTEHNKSFSPRKTVLSIAILTGSLLMVTVGLANSLNNTAAAK
jgi:hypothetical protein